MATIPPNGNGPAAYGTTYQSQPRPRPGRLALPASTTGAAGQEPHAAAAAVRSPLSGVVPFTGAGCGAGKGGTDQGRHPNKHPSKRLFWAFVSDVQGVAPPKEVGGRYWPSLVFEGGYGEALRECDKGE
jgi:hypothetical protein